jgi:hypothetical protein
MRTRPARITPSCPYCNEDHNPDIQCRYLPESPRFWLPEPKPVQPARPEKPQTITDAKGKLLAWRKVK